MRSENRISSLLHDIIPPLRVIEIVLIDPFPLAIGIFGRVWIQLNRRRLDCTLFLLISSVNLLK